MLLLDSDNKNNSSLFRLLMYKDKKNNNKSHKKQNYLHKTYGRQIF